MTFTSLLTDTGIDKRLTWLDEPEAWRFDRGSLYVDPPTDTDLFRAPDGSHNRDNAPFLHTTIAGDFTVVVRLGARLFGFGDAGAITVRTSETKWAKICLERSPIGDVSIVTVVTDGVSDDSNGELLVHPECYLRVTRWGDTYGMHHSVDGKTWRFSRTFTRDFGDEVMVGISAQAPFTEGCAVEFLSFDLANSAVQDFRSGE